MVIAAPESALPRLRDICATYNVEMTVIGHFTGDRRLRVRYGDTLAADLPMEFVHEGWPKLTLKAEWRGERKSEIGNRKSALSPQSSVLSPQSSILSTLLLQCSLTPIVAPKRPSSALRPRGRGRGGEAAGGP
jgi:phosphoribosylformylglycinamidine (FGAM) synthase-like enzyme